MRNFPETLRHGSGVETRLDRTRLLLIFSTAPDVEAARRALASAALVLEDGRDPGHPANGVQSGKRAPINHTPLRMWVRSAQTTPIDEAQIATLEKAFGVDLHAVAPVYESFSQPTAANSARFAPLPDVLMIKEVTVAGAERSSVVSDVIEQFGLHEIEEKSRYLNGYRYLQLKNAAELNAYALRDRISAEQARPTLDVRLEHMPMLVPTAVIPNDPYFPLQWDMTKIGAPSAWDIGTGGGAVVCILDSGCDQAHPDLAFASPGINLATMAPPGTPNMGFEEGHGTCCAGIVAAAFDNARGTTGLAGNATLLPVAFQNWTDAECAAGITYAAVNGARVISMSFGVYAVGDGYGPTGWDFTIIDPAIVTAVATNVVLCAATGNENTGSINRYPARNPLVIACGGSDQADGRKSPASPDGECWGANYGAGIAVAAPAVLIPTTDIVGTRGFNANSGGSFSGPCVVYPSSGDAAGAYFLQFNGTSAATPHVAGLAGLLAAKYPFLTNAAIRNIIERTASKTGGAAYSDQPGFSNGTRTPELGYGRIDAYHALDFADVYIRDYPADDGSEPSTPPAGDFWDTSDLVVRPTDDNVFQPSNLALARDVVRSQTNYVYVRVSNAGPAVARNVGVDLRVTPFVGVQFSYPSDWTAIDANHVKPTALATTFAGIPVGGSAIAKFSLSAAQVEQLWNWTTLGYHPCMVAVATAENDYAFATSSGGTDLVTRRNNLAQRNLSVVPASAGAVVTFPFVVGNVANLERELQLIVDRSGLPNDVRVTLALEGDPRTLLPNYHPQPAQAAGRIGDGNAVSHGAENGRGSGSRADGMLFLDRARVETSLGAARGVLTLEAGSRLVLATAQAISHVQVKGGAIRLENDERLVEIQESRTEIRFERPPGATLVMALSVQIPRSAIKGDAFPVRIRQRNERGEIVGGATVVYITQ